MQIHGKGGIRRIVGCHHHMPPPGWRCNRFNHQQPIKAEDINAITNLLNLGNLPTTYPHPSLWAASNLPGPQSY